MSFASSRGGVGSRVAPSALFSTSPVSYRRIQRNRPVGVDPWRNAALSHYACYAKETTNQKLISKSDIPLIFPRTDFAQQIFRWAKIEADSDGLQNFGAVIKITPYFKNPDAPENEREIWGFDGRVLRDGEPVCHLGVYMDREMVEKAEFVGIGEDRFPVDEGRIFLIEGKALEIWKLGDDPVDDDTRLVIRRFCEALSSAIETYAAFGSCFADDAA